MSSAGLAGENGTKNTEYDGASDQLYKSITGGTVQNRVCECLGLEYKEANSKMIPDDNCFNYESARLGLFPVPGGFRGHRNRGRMSPTGRIGSRPLAGSAHTCMRRM